MNNTIIDTILSHKEYVAVCLNFAYEEMEDSVEFEASLEIITAKDRKNYIKDRRQEHRGIGREHIVYAVDKSYEEMTMKAKEFLQLTNDDDKKEWMRRNKDYYYVKPIADENRQDIASQFN